jgi:hypothetical protein
VSFSAADVWQAIALDAERESPVWRDALRPWGARDREPVFSPLAERRFALALETIYEGYLVHYGSPRLFASSDANTRLLLGDYLYAQGIVHLAATGSVAAVSDMAELISLGAQLQAASRGDLDGAAWAATAALLGQGELDSARAALRERADATELRSLAESTAGANAVTRALDLHAARFG